MNRNRRRQLNLFDELIVDNFAGGGGASTGIERALGKPIDIAINHDPNAIAMHEANHPLTHHFCESVWEVDPKKVADGRPVGLAWFSPDCKHFSKAKGGKPCDKNIRGLAWVAIRWAATVQPRVIMLENVEEFTTWGPLGPDGMPCKKRKGQTFTSFTNALRRLGYEVAYKELRACDYGAPTIRKRLFLVARRDGQPIVWPQPTHGSPTSKEVKEGLLKPWRTAAECIDWSIPCPSIFEREKPLAEATLRRIARGIQKYVIDAKRPFIVTCNHGGESFRGQSVDDPFKTVTASRDAHGIVVPTLIQTGYGERTGQSPRVPGLEKPLGTLMGEGQKHAFVGATLVQCGFGEAPGSKPRCIDPDKPLGTVTAGAIKHALAVAHLIRHYGGNTKLSAQQPDAPINTITAQDHHSLVVANLIRHFGTGVGSGVDEPTRTAMTEGGGGKSGLVVSHLTRFRGDNLGSPADAPVPTVVASGINIGEVRAFLQQYNGGSVGQSLDEPMNTSTDKDRFSIVTIESIDYVIADIGMRMLQPHELFAAQGFPDRYIMAPKVNGKTLSKTAQVRAVGNSVSPCVAEALVRANMSVAPAKAVRA